MPIDDAPIERIILRRFLALLALGLAALAATPHATRAAASPASCAGVVLFGSAELMCSQVDQRALAQLCTYSWALMTTGGATKVVDGSFLLPPHTSNMQIYQGIGFDNQLSEPIVMCRGKTPHE
jgi:hypothetical protein